jgi:hypothetical protein
MTHDDGRRSRDRRAPRTSLDVVPGTLYITGDVEADHLLNSNAFALCWNVAGQEM